MKIMYMRFSLAALITLVLCLNAFSTRVVVIDNSSSGVTLLNQDRNGLTLSLNIGAIDLNTVSIREGTFTVLTIDGFSRSQQIGEPNIPMINKLISIPFGCELRIDVLDYEVEEINLDDYYITAPIMPVQPSLSKSQNPDDIDFEYKEQLYSRSGYYRLPPVSTSDVGVMRALRLGMVSLAPVEYNPTENKLRIYKNMTVRVEFLHPDWETTEEMKINYYSPFFEIVYNQIINYEPLPPTILADLVTYPVKYIIIADRMFESQLQPFIEWKTRKGFNVIVAYTDIIGYSNTAIRSYIQSVYNGSNPPSDPPPSFVLLVGDDQQIPAFSYSGHISDLDFCEFTGDHNPEIYYGRFSAQNTSLLQPQIDKTLEYEQYTMPDPAYMGDVTMIAGVDADNAPTYGNGQINYGVNLYFNSQHGIYSNTWLYPQSAQPGAAAAIIQTVNDGVGFINYTAHGSHDGWANPAFSSSNVNGLTNAHKYPLAIGNCCLTNTFGDDYPTPCVGEVWLQAANKGAIGYIGGSNSTYWDEDYWWGVGYGPIIGNGPTYEQTGLGAYDGVFHDHGEALSDHYVVNDALIFCGNLAVQESGSGLINYYWEIYHLMGDPSVMTYLGVPAVNNVQHSPVIVLSDNSFLVQADEASYIGLSKDGILHGAAYIGESGMIDMDIIPFTIQGTADLVVTGQNRQPYITTVQVIAPSGPYVIYDSCEVNDPSGNNNGLIDFGESILLDMQLKNVGPDTAYSVEVVLSTSDQYVTIVDAFEVYGNISGDFGLINVDNAFSFNVSIGIPDQHVIPFHLQITGANMDTLSGNFNLTAHAPDLKFVAYAINDETGNNNGILDAGETAELIVSLLNDGSGDAASVAGIIGENDDFVTISDSIGSFGDINAGANGQNAGDVFVVSADSLFPQGYNVLFDLGLSASGGYTVDMQFILTTAESFEYNNGGYTGNGSWQWGEPTYGPPGAHFGVKVWGTNLSGDYPNGCNDNLISTSFFIHSLNAVLEFYHWYNIEEGWDGGNVSISTNGGSSWELIVPAGGYPDQSVSALGGPGYTSISNGWVPAQFSLSDYINRSVIFRWRFASDYSITAPGWYIDDVAVTNNIPQPPPDIACDPLFFDVSVEPGTSSERLLEIFNNGSGPLYYSLNCSTENPLMNISGGSSLAAEKERNIVPVSFQTILGKSGLSQEPIYPPVVLGQGGPDGFGHAWIDSDEPAGPAVTWVNISSVGVEVFPGEDGYVSAPIGFSFPFYENSYTSLYICSNGMLSFGAGSGDYTNDPIPSTNPPDNFVAPWWDDLSPQDGHVYYYQDVVANSRFVVSYVGVPNWNYGGSLNFQVILYPDGDMDFNYATMDPGNDQLNLSTIGIENVDASDGLQIVYNANYMHSNLSIRISAGDWLSVSPNSGIIDPGDSATATVTFDASDLDLGTYTGNIDLDSNDPDTPQIDIGVTLTVTMGGIAEIIQTPANISETLESGDSVVDSLKVKNIGTATLTVSFSETAAWMTLPSGPFNIAPGDSSFYSVMLNASGMYGGTYIDSIVTATNAPASPIINTPVTLNVLAADIEVPADSISETLTEGNQTEAGLVIYNLGSATLDLNLDAIENTTLSGYEGSDEPARTDRPSIPSPLSLTKGDGIPVLLNVWLSVDPASDNIAPGDSLVAQVSLNATSLTPDVYTGQINLASNDLADPLLIIPVILEVIEAGSGCAYVVGDVNSSRSYNGLDVTYGVSFFKGGSDPMCDSCLLCPGWFYCGDVNGSCSYNGLDVTYGVAYLKGGAALIACADCPPVSVITGLRDGNTELKLPEWPAAPTKEANKEKRH